MSAYFIGIDVGTGSARAGIFDASGKLYAAAKQDIHIWKDAGGVVEQSSDDIWQAVCAVVLAALTEAKLAPDSIKGLGFDATCSLVVLGEQGKPLPVGKHGDAQRNVIVWMDHRATPQAQRINATQSPVLQYVGGKISPEMETPKLLWLAEELPSSFEQAWQFMDLTDFLTWRATHSLARSVCTVTCKWTYLAHEQRWDADYFRTIGLGVLAEEGFQRIGTDIVEGGTALAQGLTASAAADLGLLPHTPVAAGLIDAHAGGVGTVGAKGYQGSALNRMAYVFGTSACTMSSTQAPAFVPGVWGPYYSAMLPGLWLNEGGQSAAGAALDHLVTLHPAHAEATTLAQAANQSLMAWLASQAEQLGGASQLAQLVGGIHVVPEFLGNRSPLADPDSRALIAGLGMEKDPANLVSLYLAGLCGLGYGARQIVQALGANGVSVDLIVLSGGAGMTPLVRQVLADTTQVAVAISTSPEPVLLGSAILATLAAGHYPDTETAMAAMSELGDVYQPQTAMKNWHDARYQAFLKLQQVGREIRE